MPDRSAAEDRFRQCGCPFLKGGGIRMLCQNCHKNEATIHVQQIVNGHVQAFHLCEACAKKHGDAAGEDGFNLAEVLFDIAGKVANAAAPAEKEASEPETDLVCPQCGRTLQQFRKTAYLGCPGCYQAFAPLIEGMLKNMHRGDRHLGKIPGNAPPRQRKSHERMLLQREIGRLQSELEEKIRSEEYEAAAVLRDRIRELERKVRESGEKS